MKHPEPTLTPEEAAAALQDVSYRQQQVSAAVNTQPRWLYPMAGALFALQGVAADLWPKQHWVSQIGVWVVLAILAGSFVPAVGTRLEVPAANRWRGGNRYASRARMINLGDAVALCALWGLLYLGVKHADLRYPHTIVAVVIGLMLALVVPLVRRKSVQARPGDRSHVD